MELIRRKLNSSFLTVTLTIFFIGCSSIHRIENQKSVIQSTNDYIIDESENNEDENFLRTPASPEANSCTSILTTFFKKNNNLISQKDALKNKSLLTFKQGLWISPKPKLEKLAELKKSLSMTLKNWYGHKYPTYFLVNEPDLKLISDNYVNALIKSIEEPALLSDQDKAILEIVRSWIDKFESYPIELNDMLDERISLQYNLNFLKNFELNKERETVKLTFKKNGKDFEKVYIFYRKDKNLNLEIKNIQKELALFDDTLVKEGKLKERIIRQAVLKELITFVQRDIEIAAYNIKDKAIGQELKILSKEIDRLTNNSKLQTSSYGIYKLNSSIFWNEILPIEQVQTLKDFFQKTGNLIEHSYDFGKEKLRSSINFAKDSPRKVIEGVKDLLKDDVNEEGEKIGFFKKFYAKIKAIDPKKAAAGAGAIGIGFIGIEQYFALEPNPAIDCVPSNDRTPCNEAPERLENTQELINKTNEDIVNEIDAASADLF